MSSLLETLRTEFRLPEINGDRCVHAHIETASCKACVTACPENAWILDDESLGLNTDVCDGCGLCVPACTEGAVTQVQDCTIREDIDGDKYQKVLLLGCEFTGLDESNCNCVHALNSNELLKLYRDGIHHVYVAVGDCNQCSRGKNEHLSNRITNVNKMLRHNHLAPMHYNELPIEQWKDLWKAPEKAAPGQEMSRRAFFRAAIKQTVDRVFHQSTFDQTGEFVPLGKILPLFKTTDGIAQNEKESEDAFYPATPYINANKCNACNACIRACPHDALSMHEEDPQKGISSTSYKIDASACTGCNICVDICDQDAIQVTLWNSQKQTSSFPIVPLSTKKCSSCGIVFHLPEQYQDPNISSDNNINNSKSLCTICSQINHQKHLFQVLE